MRTICLTLLIFALSAACTTAPEQIPTDLEPKEYFQRAQEAVVERNDYETALRYYETFLEIHGDDIQRAVEAQYEIAFIYYKLGEYEVARARFEQLLETYESDTAEILPRWPLVLTDEVLDKMDEANNGDAGATGEE